MDKVAHFDIPADNVARAKTFYKTVFGWNIVDVPDMDYTIVHTAQTDEQGMIQERGAINGGIKKRDSQEETTTIVINVPSVDASIQQVENAGGKLVVPKMPVGDFGLYARVADTEGNVIGLWEDLKKPS